jgi:membrane protease YdiL (CAAX protease family)
VKIPFGPLLSFSALLFLTFVTANFNKRMFNRYWRSYPWWLQLIQLIILISVLFSFFVFGLGYGLVPKLMGVSLSDISVVNSGTPRPVINTVLVIQVLFSISVFLLSSLLFAYFTHPRPAEYLGLRAPRKPIQWVLVFLLMVGAIPLFLQVEAWMKLIDFGPQIKAQQETYEASVNALLNMPSFGTFLLIFSIMAVLPAIGEELLFRGIFMRFAYQRSRRIVFPVILTSLMFAFVHGNAYGVLSIFLAGVVLAVIYYLTGSIWLSILAHMLNNGMQVALIYFLGDNEVVKTANENEQLPLSIVLTGAVIFIVALLLLIKNKTPLPPNWADDYTEQELSEKAV